LFYAVRASLLWDPNATNSINVLMTTDAEDASPRKPPDPPTEGPGSLFIGEVQCGGQWSYQLKSRPACAFVRTGLRVSILERDQPSVGTDGEDRLSRSAHTDADQFDRRERPHAT